MEEDLELFQAIRLSEIEYYNAQLDRAIEESKIVIIDTRHPLKSLALIAFIRWMSEFNRIECGYCRRYNLYCTHYTCHDLIHIYRLRLVCKEWKNVIDIICKGIELITVLDLINSKKWMEKEPIYKYAYERVRNKIHPIGKTREIGFNLKFRQQPYCSLEYELKKVNLKCCLCGDIRWKMFLREHQDKFAKTITVPSSRMQILSKTDSDVERCKFLTHCNSLPKEVISTQKIEWKYAALH